MNPNEKEDLLDLANAYIDGKLDEEQSTRLDKWLKSDPEARRVFADFLHDHSVLHWLNVDIGKSSIEEIDFAAATGSERNVVERNARFGKQELILIASAACLIVGIFLYYQSTRQGNTESPIAAAVDPETTNSATVARIVRIEGGAFSADGAEFSSGDELPAGADLTMKAGLIEMVFHETGVHAIATAPLSLTVTSNEHIRLTDGEVKLHVPPQGIGFVVETEERRITDLGTSFVVAAHPEGSKVFVLDGQIAVAKTEGGTQRLMAEGEIANFNRSGETNIQTRKLAGLPELSYVPLGNSAGSLQGRLWGLKNNPELPRKNTELEDRIGIAFHPLIESGFVKDSSLTPLKKSRPIRFSGIAGAYSQFPERIDYRGFAPHFGWLAWYSGEVAPPKSGRYRFWGYADNHLMVAVDGKPVFEGSRFGSSLREELAIARTNHPSFPCLNSEAGFASGEWIEIGDQPIQLDILFGETNNSHTSGLLLIECEGENYEETFWGQPKWPIFLTELPESSRVSEMNQLSAYLEEKLQGAFSVSSESIWPVTKPSE